MMEKPVSDAFRERITEAAVEWVEGGQPYFDEEVFFEEPDDEEPG
jgi:hypothetical protein